MFREGVKVSLRMDVNLCSQGGKNGSATLFTVTTHRTQTSSKGHFLHWHGTLYRLISGIHTAKCPFRQNQASSLDADTNSERLIYAAYTPWRYEQWEADLSSIHPLKVRTARGWFMQHTPPEGTNSPNSVLLRDLRRCVIRRQMQQFCYILWRLHR